MKPPACPYPSRPVVVDQSVKHRRTMVIHAITSSADRRGAMLASHEDFFPPLRPAAAFCALLPPLPEPLLLELWLLPKTCKSKNASA